MQEIMVLTASPEGFPSWPRARRAARHGKVMEWHDRMAALSINTLPYVWASTQVLSQARLSPIQTAYLAVYRVADLREFDELMIRDPLRQCSHYMTILLAPLATDHEDDKRRFEQMFESVRRGKSTAQLLEIERHLAEFRAPPEYVGKYKHLVPTNPLMPYDPSLRKDLLLERPLEVLIYGSNPPEYMAWSDVRKVAHYQKVMWWHDHIAQMLTDGRMSHVWGTYDFCDNAEMRGNSAQAPSIYRARDLDEFSAIYRLDPLRTQGRFLSMILKPIHEQRRLDELLASGASHADVPQG